MTFLTSPNRQIDYCGLSKHTSFLCAHTPTCVIFFTQNIIVNFLKELINLWFASTDNPTCCQYDDVRHLDIINY
jgi:hypothetical protein